LWYKTTFSGFPAVLLFKKISLRKVLLIWRLIVGNYSILKKNLFYGYFFSPPQYSASHISVSVRMGFTENGDVCF